MKSRKAKGINLLIFVGFAIVYAAITDRYFYSNKTLPVAIGIFLIVTGLWGLVINEVLLKISFSDDWGRIINIALAALGVICLLYGIYNSLG